VQTQSERGEGANAQESSETVMEGRGKPRVKRTSRSMSGPVQTRNHGCVIKTAMARECTPAKSHNGGRKTREAKREGKTGRRREISTGV